MEYRKGNITVKPTKKSDSSFVAENMRRSDVIEVRMSDGLSGKLALDLSVERSDEAYTIKISDVPIAIFGIAGNKMAMERAAIWMLGTYAIEKNVKAFHDVTKKYLDYFHRSHKILFNFVMAENKTSLTWLKKLGAEFSSPKEYGHYGALFRYFELRRA